MLGQECSLPVTSHSAGDHGRIIYTVTSTHYAVATPRKLPPIQVVPRIQAKWLFPEWQVSTCYEALLSRCLASPLRQKCLLKNYDAGQREALHTPKGTQSLVNMVDTAYPGYMD